MSKLIKFEFCQNGQCCTMDSVAAQQKGNTNSYLSGNPIIDSCSSFNFETDTVQGHVTFADISTADDGWSPEFIKLFLKSGVVILCLEFGIGIIDTNTPGVPAFLDFECKPGMFLSLFIMTQQSN